MPGSSRDTQKLRVVNRSHDAGAVIFESKALRSYHVNIESVDISLEYAKEYGDVRYL